ncbi:DUF1853 family protein [Psychroflexus aestuariivivens]|uniref:DUF1853 family protein n=1 Tax=Psychroflexus aestuariivivens TaxID=1795040 RepID=UPI000FD9D09E|nr:DUF1853 family protein [Psychroflexus aestuariivivens]
MPKIDTKTEILKQFQGFLNTNSIIDQMPNSEILAFDPASKIDFDSDEFPFEDILKHKFVGKRAEHFLYYYFLKSNHFEIISFSLQVILNKQTFGEFDFIVKDLRSDEILHIELVNKIYLFDENLHEDIDYCWIGPNRKDRFLDKINKLEQHQFPLLYRQETESFLEDLNLKTINISQKICYKAILFIPENCKFRFFRTNLNCLSGYYYRFDEILNKKWQKHQFYIPEKLNWFIDETQHNDWENFNSVLIKIEKLLANKQSPMVFRKNESGEVFKLFVTWW